LPQAARAAWVCGLGHGVLQHTPEENVRLVLKLEREMFA
jgi:uroporphyrinogen-III decarboxylase